MSYSNVDFLFVFLPIVVTLYYIIPQKFRWIILLGASYIFFISISEYLIVFLLVTTLITYLIALWIHKIGSKGKEKLKAVPKEDKKTLRMQIKKHQQLVIALGVIVNIGLLFYLKYFDFAARNMNALFSSINISAVIPKSNIAMPIGISFYSLQAVSYICDVYRGKIEADRNLARFALYMSFFPIIMEGPICRYTDTAYDIYAGNRITYDNFKCGVQRIIYGMFKKIVVADRLNVFVKDVFLNYTSYDGTTIFMAMILYTCQLYMDFSGVMDIVIGIGRIFGVKIPENFRQPFFSKSISEFWTRWHITLGTWFRDYLYYPISLTKPLKKLTSNSRKKLGSYYGPLFSGTIALSVVWFCNGLWHGSAWNYIFFGLYHFVLITGGNIIQPLSRNITEKLHINREKTPYKIMQIIRTVILVNFGELFFRAHGLQKGFGMFKKIFTNISLNAFSDSSLLDHGLDAKDFAVIALSVLFVFVIGIVKEKGIDINKKIAKLNTPVRWIIYLASILGIIIFGAYGAGYLPVDPMYAGF